MNSELIGSGLALSAKDLDDNWNTMLADSTLEVKNYSKKEDFTKNLLSLYKVYDKPVLLFLGDLTDYSIQLQEGMLKLLEEPPKNLYVILFSQTKGEVLQTISSRCRFHFLQKNVILSGLLDGGLLEKTKKLFPPPGVFVQEYIKGNADFAVFDLKKAERNELNFWFWQVCAYLEEIYKKNPSVQLAEYIKKILEAQKLNSENLQKKFALSWLDTF